MSQAGHQGRCLLASANTPTLDSLARDLTAIAREGSLDPVIGRGKEIQRVIEVLSRRTKNNPVLIGEPVSVKQPSLKVLHNKLLIMKFLKSA